MLVDDGVHRTDAGCQWGQVVQVGDDGRLMGQGDVLFLYTDGLLDPFSTYNQERMERAVSRAKDGTAKEICESVLADRNSTAEQTDDLSVVVIKYG